jgi:hypothetical protein
MKKSGKKLQLANFVVVPLRLAWMPERERERERERKRETGEMKDFSADFLKKTCTK